MCRYLLAGLLVLASTSWSLGADADKGKSVERLSHSFSSHG
jgi:hypothetical protein